MCSGAAPPDGEQSPYETGQAFASVAFMSVIGWPVGSLAGAENVQALAPAGAAQPTRYGPPATVTTLKKRRSMALEVGGQVIDPAADDRRQALVGREHQVDDPLLGLPFGERPHQRACGEGGGTGMVGQ